MIGDRRTVFAVAALFALTGAPFAQTTTPPPTAAPTPTAPLGPVQTAPRGELAEPAPQTGDVPPQAQVAEPAAQTIAPTDPATTNTERIFIDTRVTDVRVGDELTVATMSQSVQSACASNEYVFERTRAKWLFQTGRLLQAMREGAVLRISFTCRKGYQSINAIQFLSPPTTVAQDTPRPGNIVRVAPQPAARPTAIPLPTGAGATADQPLEQRIRQIPAP